MVNQAALTGESMPVRKTTGATVYAGTVVEEGECVLVAKAEGGANRYDKIVAMIEESEKLKSGTENRALQLADRLVPWCLAGTVATYAFTRNVTRAISILMVDFSCALKLSMPLAVLSAMRECGEYHITVKGGKYLEALAKADTIVFDKTGTLTRATPQVVQVVPFSGCGEQEVLQLAACLEEHFPHSMANAWSVPQGAGNFSRRDALRGGVHRGPWHCQPSRGQAGGHRQRSLYFRGRGLHHPGRGTGKV